MTNQPMTSDEPPAPFKRQTNLVVNTNQIRKLYKHAIQPLMKPAACQRLSGQESLVGCFDRKRFLSTNVHFHRPPTND